MNATVDGTEVYLKENPAFSFSFFDFIDPTKVKGATATTIEIAATQEAEGVMGSRNMAERPARREHVLEVGPGYWKGRIAVMERADDVIRCESVAGNGGWIAQAKDKRLRTLAMGNSEPVTDTYQRQTWTDDNDPVYFPLIDYGSFEFEPDTFNVVVRKLRPGIRVWKVLERAFSEMGYTVSPVGRLQNVWRKLVMPNVRDTIEIPQELIDGNRAEFSKDTQSITPAPVTSFGLLETDTVDNDPSNRYTAPYRYTSGFDLETSMEVRLTLDATFLLSNSNALTSITILDNLSNAVGNATFIIPTTGTTLTALELVYNVASFQMVAGRTYRVQWSIITAPGGDPTSITLSDVSVAYTPISGEYQENAPVVIASLNPDWTVADLVKNLTGLYCLTWRTDDSTNRVTVAHWDDTLQPTTNGIDFRGRENQAYPVKVTPLAPSAFNFRYSPDPNDERLVEYVKNFRPPGYGNADRLVPNGTERPEEIELDFSATAMGNALGGLFMPVMYRENGTPGVDDYDYNDRILLADGTVTGSWVHNGDAQTVVPKCYFIYPGETRYGLAFGRETIYGQASPGLVEQHYRERIAQLGTSYTLDIDLRLDDDELLGFDFTRPVYVDDGFGGGWYYIINVDQKQFGTDAFTRCTLLQA